MPISKHRSPELFCINFYFTFFVALLSISQLKYTYTKSNTSHILIHSIHIKRIPNEMSNKFASLCTGSGSHRIPNDKITPTK